MDDHRRSWLKAGSIAAASLGTAACATPGNTPAPVSAAAVAGAALFEITGRSTLPIVGRSEVFPIRRIYCVGRNYAAHAREMGSDPTREPPFFFQKPTDAIQLVPPGVTVDHPYPSQTKNYHYELELVVALHKGGRDIPVASALEHVFGYGVGLDMTRRDLQRMMGDQKKPWEIGKSFDRSAPCSPLYPASQVGHFTKGRIELTVNGQVKQSADLAQMMWNVAEQVSYLSTYYELFPGDIIYSGTPENVGPVKPGDLMVGVIEKLGKISVKVV